MEKNRNFIWDTRYFNSIDENTKECALKMKELGLIKDVYLRTDLNDNLVYIEQMIDCGPTLRKIKNKDYNDIQSMKKSRTFKIPLQIKPTMQLGCNQRESLKCNYLICPIIAAAFYYQEDKIEQLKEIKKVEQKKKKEEKLKEKNSQIIDSILNEKLQEKYGEIIYDLKTEVELTDSVKIELVKLIKTLGNLKYLQETMQADRPILNYAIQENTNTIRNICLGQEKCLEYLMKILRYFDIITNNKYRILNLKELALKDELKLENYNEDIIVITNLYAMNDTDNATEDKYVKIIKNNLPSFILNNSKNKIFILCDKNANISVFFAKYPQLKLLFDMIKISDLKVTDIYEIFLNKINNLCLNEKEEFIDDNSFSIECNFDIKLMEYLEQEYMFSAYQNLEFVEFLYKTILKNILSSDNPNFITIKHFPKFRVDDNLDFDSFNSLIGLDNIKNEIQNLYAYLDLQKSKKAKGDNIPDTELHMVYLGNPGTGKTTVARFMGSILFNLGFIRYNKCIECESKDLISDVAGQTSIKTSDKIQEAMGGILFIDEAYAIGESVYGTECVATLIKAMEDYRDDLVVILAGYKIEMQRFLDINSGFTSRVSYIFEFKDYTIEELIDLTMQLFNKYNLKISGSMITERLEEIYAIAKRDLKGFGNGRYVRTTVDKILKQHAINTVNVEDEYKRNNLITISDLNFMK